MKMLKNILDNFEKYCCDFLMVFLVVLLSIQVFYRYLLGTGVAWSEELSRFVFVWTVFLAASYVTQRQQHIRVTVILDMLPKSLKKYVSAFGDGLWVIFNIFIIATSMKIIYSMFEFKNMSAELGINQLYFELIVPISFLLMTIRMIQIYLCKLLIRKG